jgi:hypothetical protein
MLVVSPFFLFKKEKKMKATPSQRKQSVVEPKSPKVSSPKKQVVSPKLAQATTKGSTMLSSFPNVPDLPLLYRRDLLTEGKDRFFAPLNIPFERRLQTLALFFWIIALPVSMLIILCIIGLIASTWFYISTHLATFLGGILAAYLSTYFFRKPYQRKGSGWATFTKTRAFGFLSSLFCQYFPSRVVFDGLTPEECEQVDGHVERDFFHAGKRYLCCCHPHGLFGLGVWGAFVAKPANPRGGHAALSRLMHGGNRKLQSPKTTPTFQYTAHTMTMNFNIPAWREWLLSIGFRDVEKRTLLRCLAEDPTTKLGHLAFLVPGGAAESLNCTEPILTLKNRKGFVKIALLTGCHLVPVYTFGETKLYKPLTKNRKVLLFIRKIQKLIGLGTPLVCGRGIFNYGFGMLPHRETLTTVVGRPIVVEKNESFTARDVDVLHAQYVEAICSLYRRYQPVYDPLGAEELTLV